MFVAGVEQNRTDASRRTFAGYAATTLPPIKNLSKVLLIKHLNINNQFI